jgi:hypothetical protein
MKGNGDIMTSEQHKNTKGSGRAVDSFFPFCQGDIEPTLNKRIHMLVDLKDDYIVYVDDDFFVQWSNTYEYEKTKPHGLPNIENKLRYLETLSRTALHKSQFELFAGLLAEAMARIMGDKNEKKAEEALSIAESYLRARSSENARSWYIRGSLVAALPTLIVTCILWLIRADIADILGHNAFEVILGSLIGGTGALFSILSRTASIQMDPTAGSCIHYLESASRVLAGNIGAFITALAVKANIFLGFTKTMDYSFALLLVLCICAGASERLVPGFIKRIETSVDSEQKQK